LENTNSEHNPETAVSALSFMQDNQIHNHLKKLKEIRETAHGKFLTETKSGLLDEKGA
jgi:hypothetical protein